MNEQFVLILTNDDGDISVDVLDRETLLKRLNTGYYGEGAYQPKFHAGAPPSDPMTWGDTRALLVRGTIVAPGAEKIVERFTV